MSRPRRFPASVWILTIAMASVVGLYAQTASPLTGTWKLNVAKSKYSPADLAPKSGMTKAEVTQDGIKVTTDGVDSKGRKTHSEYSAKLDGKDVSPNAMVDGKPNADQDAVSWKKIDNNTYENVTKLKGKTLTTSRVVVAKDGKTRTNTVTGKNAQGQTVNSTSVYEKQ